MPTIDSDVAALERALGENPEDEGIRGMLVDAHLETGDEAEAWRVAKRREPWPRGDDCAWANYTLPGYPTDRSKLPPPLYAMLSAMCPEHKRHRQTDRWKWLEFRVTEEAAALRAAFDALTPDDRAACWAWHPSGG